MIAGKYTEMQINLKYPKEDPAKIAEIEDMAGKENRVKALEIYRDTIRLAKRIYHEEQSKIDEAFKLALFEEYGVNNHPKRERIFEKAWSRGHSDGYSQVEYEFSELVDIIQD